jgi:curved DNA-binding protein CbpA
LAYATLSDPQKRTIYDRYGEEDPDNQMSGGGGVHMRRGGGPEMTPEEIFQAFFGGGMPGQRMPGGVHFYSTGFGPGAGMHFRSGGFPPRNRAQQQEQNQQNPGWGLLMQMMPVLVILLMTFLGQSVDEQSHRSMPGENQYFSLTVRACTLGEKNIYAFGNRRGYPLF